MFLEDLRLAFRNESEWKGPLGDPRGPFCLAFTNGSEWKGPLGDPRGPFRQSSETDQKISFRGNLRKSWENPRIRDFASSGFWSRSDQLIGSEIEPLP